MFVCLSEAVSVEKRRWIGRMGWLRMRGGAWGPSRGGMSLLWGVGRCHRGWRFHVRGFAGVLFGEVWP